MDTSRNAPPEAALVAREASSSRASAPSRAARQPAGARRPAGERRSAAARRPGSSRRLAGALLAAAALLLLATPAARAAGDEKVRSGKWNPKKAPPGWVVVETDHYQVQSQCGKDKALLLSAHLESMLELYEQFLPTRRKLDGFVLKLFKDRQAFRDYGGSQNAVAYYNQGEGELVGYDTGIVLGKRDIPAQFGLVAGVAKDFTPESQARLTQLFEEITDAYTMDTARVLSHEGWHQYFHFYTTSIVTMPAWLDEGVGDYFFMASRDEQNGGKGGYRLGDLNHNRMRVLQRAFIDGTSVSFQKMLGFAQEQYYENPSVSYAQGWSMVQFLMHHEDAARRALIPKLIKDFKDTKNFPKSTAKLFKGIDMDELDRQFVGWVLQQQPVDPLKSLAREFGDKLKTSDFTGETRLVPVFDWYVKHPEATPAADPPDEAAGAKPGKSPGAASGGITGPPNGG